MWNRTSVRWVLAGVCVWAMAATAAPARVIYVDDDAGGAGDGSSWQNACRYLQDALALAEAAGGPVEIRVAQGFYRPDQGTGIAPGDQAATFRLPGGLTLTGGYAGVSASPPDTRDPGLYETILSGDLLDNDSVNPASTRDNSCRVVTAESPEGEATLDGFTIIGGSLVGKSCGNELGASTSITVDGAALLLRRCRFTGNRTGAVAAFNGSRPTLVECEFQGASLTSRASRPVLTACLFSDGGRLWGYEESELSLTDCVFESCHVALRSSGESRVTLHGCLFRNNESYAIWLTDGNAVLTDCIFEGNRKGFTSGTCIQSQGGDLALTDCLFAGNNGTAINSSRGNVVVTRCSFIGNAMAVSTHGTLILRACEFIGNSGRQEVGAVRVTGDQLQATGCLFAGNSASIGFSPGAIFAATTLVHISHCTFTGNRGRPATLDRWNAGPTSRAELTHCVVWDGPDPFQGQSVQPPQIDVAYSDVQGGFPGEGNMTVDPCFVNPGYWADPDNSNVEIGPDDANAVWVNGDYHLKSQAGHWDRETRTWVRDEVTSACIDAGDPNAPLGTEPFPNGGYVNLGAYGGSDEASKSYFGEPVCETQIAGDINGDCKVDQTDMDIMLSHWLMDAADLVNAPPTITLIQPRDGETFEYPTALTFWANVADPDGSVLQMWFVMEYAGNSASFLDTNPSSGWTANVHWWQHTGVPFNGPCTVWAEAMDDKGAVTRTPKVKVTLKVSN